MSIAHGTLSKYTNHGCSCDICRAAAAKYHRERRHSRRGEPLPDFVRHGTENAYRNYMCRCEPCREANSAYAREWRNKVKQ